MAAAKATLELGNTTRRDVLISSEKKYQRQWREKGIFNADAPTTNDSRPPKFFGTFAYPYMNGTLHVGHSFTASKVEFTAGFARMQGKRVLFPVGFHCTGMPIKTCADKLRDEVQTFGEHFENYEEEHSDPSDPPTAPAPTQSETKEDITKFTSKKSKASAKTAKRKYQFQTMLAMGIPKNEIHKFADAKYWLKHFPPLCKQDLDNFGARVDWRRSFVTTDANPYYDAFVRWQMNRLKNLDKIRHGIRYTMYSPKDGQPCMDHDRSEGEGVGHQDYTAMKLKVKEWAPEAAELIKGKLPPNANVYFVPATLRPETMYGQTCCFVGPKINYGIFKVSEDEYYFVTKRAAWNMAFQGTFFRSDRFPRSEDQLKPVVELTGSSVVGTLVNAPLSIHTQGVRILPMESVLPTKGTGVVTSVPSDSPDDYATVTDLAKKADYYNIKKEWAELEIPPVIKTTTYGDLIAPALVKKMKINSPKDTKLLAEAKDIAYKEGYYKGEMLVGDFKGQSVEVAKPKVKEALINGGEALEYAEPNGHVVSRSGDECVVAYLGQWFLNYGEDDPEWRDQVFEHVKGDMETYSSETQNGFEKNLEWLNRWACARTYGLGSKLPWDKDFLVESLSDSTIYMAYYTIAHFLHSDNFGTERGLLDIKPHQMTDEVWDYLFCKRELTQDAQKESGISWDDLKTMKGEFEYWYPLDMRVSGKDLIPNHLTFFLYIHVALFPREYWPVSIRVNGHLLLNGEKMSKSTGNFLTLNDAVQKYGADACRIALADAGDGVDDANFVEELANKVILRMYNLREWCESVVQDKKLRTGEADTLWDKLFENEMSTLVEDGRKAYEATDYKLALKYALYDFSGARDTYREATTAADIPMHRTLINTYIELQALLITPIAPHWADYIWQEVLHKPSTIQLAQYPTRPSPDPSLTATQAYMQTTASAITSSEANAEKKQKKGKTVTFDPKLKKRLTIFYATSFPTWQDECITLVKQHFPDEQAVKKAIPNSDKKKAIPFAQELLRRVNAGESKEVVFNHRLPYDEGSVLADMIPGLKKTARYSVVEVVEVEVGTKKGVVKVGEGQGEKREELPPMAESASPGQPSFECANI